MSNSFKSNLNGWLISVAIALQESANWDNTLITAVMAGSLVCADDRTMEAMLKHFQIFTLLNIWTYYNTDMPFYFPKRNDKIQVWRVWCFGSQCCVVWRQPNISDECTTSIFVVWRRYDIKGTSSCCIWPGHDISMSPACIIESGR
jgi:hypothetical protein